MMRGVWVWGMNTLLAWDAMGRFCQMYAGGRRLGFWVWEVAVPGYALVFW